MESNENMLLESELDLQREDKRLGDARLEIYERVLEFLDQLGLTDRELRPRDSLVVRDDAELHRIKKAIEAYRGLREETRVKLPALKYAIAKLELASSEYLAAWKDFSSVAAMVAGGSDKGFAHFATFRAAMERRNWDAALTAYLAAAKADPSFELFPMARYKPVRVLGTGAYGVSVLCKDLVKDTTVVVKSLWKEDLARDVEEVFDEMRSLSQLDHPNIIRVLDCGSFNSSLKSRPYIVMDYFEGRSLESLVREEGTLPSKDVIAIAIKVASAVQAGHVRNILHRGVKPGNVLVLRKDDKWDVRVIDFGLELRDPDMEIAAVSMRSPVGLSVGGTADSAAPEQIGKIDLPVGPASDMFGLAKTCCYALFQTPRPTKAQFNFLPKIITDVLDECLEKYPEDRPESMKVVLDDLNRIMRDLQVSTRYVPAAGMRWSDERKEESPLERRERLRREAEEREEYEDDYEDDDYEEEEEDDDEEDRRREREREEEDVRRRDRERDEEDNRRRDRERDEEDTRRRERDEEDARRRDRERDEDDRRRQRDLDDEEDRRRERERGDVRKRRDFDDDDDEDYDDDDEPKKKSNHLPLLIGGGFVALLTIVVVIIVVASGKSSSTSKNDQASNLSNASNNDAGNTNTAPQKEPVFKKPFDLVPEKKPVLPKKDQAKKQPPVVEKEDPPVVVAGPPALVGEYAPLRPVRDTSNDFIMAKGPRVYLSDLTVATTRSGLWPVSLNGEFNRLRDNKRQSIMVEGGLCPKSIGMCPNNGGANGSEGFTAVAFNLARKGGKFHSGIAIDDNAKRSQNDVIFEVIGDGRRLFRSPGLRESGDTIPVVLDVIGIELLELRVVCIGPSVNATWLPMTGRTRKTKRKMTRKM
jgi:hypothetical protein